MKIKKYLIVYLILTFGICWGSCIIYALFYNQLSKVVGNLNMSNPLVSLVLYTPTIAGLIIYFWLDGRKGVKGILKKFVPRKQDCFWFPILIGGSIIFLALVHYLCILFNIAVPHRTLTNMQTFTELIRNLYEETGLLGGVLGWYGFLLPYGQKIFKNNIFAAVFAGFLCGLFVMPGYLFQSFEMPTLYPLYVLQLILFEVCYSFIFNATNGNLLFYVLSFWFIASGSRLQLYYFRPEVQIMQVIIFISLGIVLYLVYRKKNIQLQTFPDFILKPESVRDGE